MPEDAEHIEHTLARLARTVSDALTASGWQTRQLGPPTGVALTRTTRNGVMATAQLTLTPSRRGNGWPVEIRVRLGVGYEPALNLMPLLTLRPVLTLLDNPDTPGPAGYTRTLHSAEDIDTTSRPIITVIDEHAPAFAEQFSTPADIEAALRPTHPIPPPDPEASTDHKRDPLPVMRQDRVTTLRLVLLATAGNHTEARALLADYPAHHGGPGGTISEHDQRFIRQLTRWLDAGGPTPVPLTDTLALLPPTPRPSLPSFSAAFSTARAHSAARNAALDAARARAPGASLDQLKDIVAAEHTRRGLEIAASDIALNADMLLLEQQPFGRARTVLRGFCMLTSVGADVLRLITHAGQRRTPDELQRPARATYRVTTEPGRYIAVDLDDDAQDWLARIVTDTPRRLGPYVLVDVWLTPHDPSGDSPPRLVAHIGSHRVGTVPAANTNAFHHVMHAAELFDEDPYLPGRLTHTRGPTLLEIPLPPSGAE